jgi:hypothetical protein
MSLYIYFILSHGLLLLSFSLINSLKDYIDPGLAKPENYFYFLSLIHLK